MAAIVVANLKKTKKDFKFQLFWSTTKWKQP
jgi:hypothetical protein